MLRIMEGNFHGTADIVPVDMAINLMIAAGWKTAQEKYVDYWLRGMNKLNLVSSLMYPYLFVTCRCDEIKVYNCTTGQLNKLTWGKVGEFRKCLT